MSTEPSGIRPVLSALRPWRRRVTWLVGSWAAVVLASAALGVQPDVPRVAAGLAVLAALAWYAVDHASSSHVTLWPLTDSSLGAGGRGNDFRVTNLAARLEAADTRGEGAPDLVRDLHLQLSTIIRERLHAKHGLVIEEEPKWSEGVMPKELWDFLVELPPPDLYRPARLDPILRRIEQW